MANWTLQVPDDDDAPTYGRMAKPSGRAVAEWFAPIGVTLAICVLILALPLALGFDPVDAANFADAPGLAKISAFADGWRHSHQKAKGIHEVEFCVDDETFLVTFADDGEPLKGVNELLEKVESYRKEPEEETQAKTGIMSEEDAQRILAEWGLAK